MAITLENIKEKQTKIAEMIAKFEAQATTSYVIPGVTIELKQGEHYAGTILSKDGDPSYYLILLPGESPSINWEKSKEWAKDAGGELPTRQEQSLLFANLKDQFESAYYWSSEQHASYSFYAWFQGFGTGYQYDNDKSAELRARAVRRLTIL